MISVILFATTLGAVAGPNLVNPMGHVALHWRIPELPGPFILAAVAYALAGLVLFLSLRPDPLLVARALGETGAPAQTLRLSDIRGAIAGLFGGGVRLGTAIITDATPLETRARTQGAVDLCVALTGAASGILSGFIVASSSDTTLALAMIPLAVAVSRSAPHAVAR